MRFVDEKEAAKMMGFSRYTLQKWRVTGRGPVFQKVGVSVRYALEDIAEYMDSFGIKHSTSEQPTEPRNADPDADGDMFIRQWLRGKKGWRGRERYVCVPAGPPRPSKSG